MANLYAFHQGVGGNGQLWYSVFDGTNWGEDTQIQPLGMSGSPAAVAWAGGITVFHQGSDKNGQLWYTYSGDGTNWDPDTQVPNVSFGESPSAVVYNGLLYVFHQGFGDDQQLWYTVFDGTNWSEDTLIQNVNMSGSPAAVAWAGGITVFHQGPGDGQLWYTFSGDGITWSGGDALVENLGMSESPSAVVYNGLLYVFHQGFGDNGELWYSVFDGTNWSEDALIQNVNMSGSPSAVAWADGITVFHQGPDNSAQLWYTFSGDGVTWTGGDALVQNLGMSFSPGCVNPSVPAPAAGLGSNSNYILYSNCNPLINLSVTIDVTEDIVCESSSGSYIGFGFQLNAYSPPNETSAFQQYVLTLWGNELIGWVDNWPISGPNIINDFFNLTSSPNLEVPAGYQLTISLENDQNGNVTAATYVVIDNSGNTLANVTQNLLSIAGVTPDFLAPIVAFELDLVGPANGESAVLSSGAGTITYTASSLLTVLNQAPPCIEAGFITLETANSFYSELPSTSSNTFTQSFNVSTAAPMIRKLGKPRPSTRWVATRAGWRATASHVMGA
jgi:hypothetical protein